MLRSVEYPTQSQACVRKASHLLPSAFMGTHRISVNGIPIQSNGKILGYEHQIFLKVLESANMRPFAEPLMRPHEAICMRKLRHIALFLLLLMGHSSSIYIA